MTSPTIISLGGSLVAPNGVDIDFISRFRILLTESIKGGQRFIVFVGGGKVCRQYQEAARALGADRPEALDWVGIYATRLNAELMRVVFGELAHGEIITDPNGFQTSSSPIVIGAGWKPGWSTDFVAVEMAERSGAKRIVNLSNIDFVYDKDPKKSPDARKIEKVSWADFRKILPNKWTPGVNAPFAPVAAKRADELGLEVAIMNGNNLDNFKNYLDGKELVGTTIRS